MPLRFPRYAKQKPSKTTLIAQKVIESVNAKYNKGKAKEKRESSVMMMEDSIFSAPRPYFPSGILPIDCIVGYGQGFPAGIIEIYGPETGGKTAIIENTIAKAQRLGYHTIFYPSEYSANVDRMRRLGVDLNSLIVIDVDTIEEFFSRLKTTVREIRSHDKVTPILVGWDSIASTPTNSEQENPKELHGSDMGKMAQQLSKFFRRLRGFLFRNTVCLIAANQTRTSMSKYNPETTAGGKALRFYAWVRCRISRVELITDSHDNEIGQISLMKITKNKFAPPFQKCKFHVYWNRGIDKVMTIWEHCIEHDIIKQKGSSYRYRGAVVTRKNFPKFYESHKKEIRAKILKGIGGE